MGHGRNAKSSTYSGFNTLAGIETPRPAHTLNPKTYALAAHTLHVPATLRTHEAHMHYGGALT
jgi:hypothetical protein